MPRISLVVAHTRNRTIGRDGGMPWELPADLRHFKKVTMGKPIIMGRKTFEAIGRALPGRHNIVITSSDVPSDQGVTTAKSLDGAIKAAGDVDEVMVIGGGQVYAEALPRARRIYLTEIAGNIDGDTFFPEIDPDDWREISRLFRASDGPNQWDINFIVLERR